MLSVFFGSDRKLTIDAALVHANKISSEVTTIDEHSFYPGQFLEATATTPLFGEQSVYLVDTPSNQPDLADECYSALKEMAGSSNYFFIVEGPLLAASKKKYTKFAEHIEEFSADKAETFNMFSLAEALARRDKKSLWVLVQEAGMLGIREEEIIGILWWQIKSIRLASLVSSAEEAGMKDYPFRKAKQALNKFSTADIKKLSHSLLQLYHRGHKGRVDLRLALEKWVLQM